MTGSSEKDFKDEEMRSKINNSQVVNSKHVGTDYSYKHEIVWRNVIVFGIVHILGAWGIYLFLTASINWKTCIWNLTLLTFLSQGITSGAHRLFAHRCYKAKTPLKVFLLLMQTASGQNSLHEWVRDHRLHHRYSDTDADPHNSSRGFFFSHVGWILTRKHPYVKEFGKRTDMSDLEADWMVMFQKKYYVYLYIITAILIPVMVPYYFGETLKNSILVCYFGRYVYQLNCTWLVNSAAHLYGTRPYDRSIQPVESWFVSFATMGEGWHNYHHAFPWDYKAAELVDFINPSARFIDFCAKLGLAYDLKTASPEMVANRIRKAGDGTYFLSDEEYETAVRALGPKHPLNPTFNVTYPPPNVTLREEGLPLFEKDLIENNLTQRKIATA
ncbi:unnamed protein product [Leptosia nina]|uniref:Fatty acid desaturase domain-containing protein n=1 Tax=Leptosia nina TaxID=320188 RepID=A0AAV1J385_9NEOP